MYFLVVYILSLPIILVPHNFDKDQYSSDPSVVTFPYSRNGYSTFQVLSTSLRPPIHTLHPTLMEFLVVSVLSLPIILVPHHVDKDHCSSDPSVVIFPYCRNGYSTLQVLLTSIGRPKNTLNSTLMNFVVISVHSLPILLVAHKFDKDHSSSDRSLVIFP